MASSTSRASNILDEGDEFQVQLYQGGVQVAGVLVPVGPAGSSVARIMAEEISSSWLGNDKAP